MVQQSTARLIAATDFDDPAALTGYWKKTRSNKKIQEDKKKNSRQGDNLSTTLILRGDIPRLRRSSHEVIRLLSLLMTYDQECIL
jgi:hypothetical protein